MKAFLLLISILLATLLFVQPAASLESRKLLSATGGTNDPNKPAMCTDPSGRYKPCSAPPRPCKDPYKRNCGGN